MISVECINPDFIDAMELRLREAMRYTWHLGDCGYHLRQMAEWYQPDSTRDCTCGLDALRADLTTAGIL